MADAVARWRIIHGRGPTTTAMTQRDEQDAWEVALAASGLPVAVDGRGRPRVAFAVPLPVGFEARAERFDVFLTARVRAADLRGALVAIGPPDHPIAEVHDVWLGASALAAAVAALDYLVTVEPTVEPDRLAVEADALLAAPRLERTRAKGGTTRTYDLRPLLIDLRARAGSAVWMRLRADPGLGVGRPDEVVASLRERLSGELALAAGVRERIWLVDEPR
jgi:radical SAM-linked protein